MNIKMDVKETEFDGAELDWLWIGTRGRLL
jgi:hypothetical protein